MQEWAERFYNSKQWKKCRSAYKKIVHYQCEINDPEISLSFRNLRLLCRKCHGAAHGNAATMEGVYFDADGNLVQSPPS